MQVRTWAISVVGALVLSTQPALAQHSVDDPLDPGDANVVAFCNDYAASQFNSYQECVDYVTPQFTTHEIEHPEGGSFLVALPSGDYVTYHYF